MQLIQESETDGSTSEVLSSHPFTSHSKALLFAKNQKAKESEDEDWSVVNVPEDNFQLHLRHDHAISHKDVTRTYVIVRSEQYARLLSLHSPDGGYVTASNTATRGYYGLCIHCWEVRCRFMPRYYNS